jgi:hypothetical protein
MPRCTGQLHPIAPREVLFLLSPAFLRLPELARARIQTARGHARRRRHRRFASADGQTAFLTASIGAWRIVAATRSTPVRTTVGAAALDIPAALIQHRGAVFLSKSTQRYLKF